MLGILLQVWLLGVIVAVCTFIIWERLGKVQKLLEALNDKGEKG